MDITSFEDKNVSVINLGCRTNAAETAEIVAGLYRLPQKVVIINSCTVTQAADRDTRKAIYNAKRSNPDALIVLLGCHVDAHPEINQALGVDLAIPNALKPIASNLISSFANGDIKPREINLNNPQELSLAASPNQPLPPGAFRSRFNLKIQDGCDNRCTFCIVWQTRGRSISRTPSFCIEQARLAASAGYKEIVLTGIDLGSYKSRPGYGLAELINDMTKELEGVRIRLSSLDPSHVTKGLAKAIEHNMVCPHFHLPLQSGSDQVLARMRRRYTVDTFLEAVELLRTHKGTIALTGDIMVGFPGEADRDFQCTLDVVQRAGFTGLHVFRFSPRPRTAASRYQDRPSNDIAKARSHTIIELGKTLKQNFETKFIGKELEVIWDRPSVDNLIKGISREYIVVYAEKQNRAAGQLELVSPASVFADGLRA